MEKIIPIHEPELLAAKQRDEADIKEVRGVIAQSLFSRTKELEVMTRVLEQMPDPGVAMMEAMLCADGCYNIVLNRCVESRELITLSYWLDKLLCEEAGGHKGIWFSMWMIPDDDEDEDENKN